MIDDRVFLLSPAFCGGRRAAILLRDELVYACLRCGDRPTGARPPKLPRATVLLAGLTLFCAPRTAPPAPAPFALIPCAVGGVSAECGAIRVFENRDTKRGRQIDIHFAVVRGHTDTPKRAVFEFAGGPGQSGVDLVATADGWIAPLRQSADLVFVDQRGTGQSHPLACEPAAGTLASAFGHVFDPARVKRCRAALEANADLTQYTSDIAAADIDDVRSVLGYESISIYGGSYGTRLALMYMRRFPTHVRVAVLDGVVPPDINVPLMYATSAEASLQRVFAACAADFLCGPTHPHVAEHFQELLQRLDKGPLDATVRGAGGESVNVRMNRGDFGYAVRGLLYTAGIASRLASMIDDAAASGRLDGFAQAYVERQNLLDRTLAFGQHLSVFCAEDVPFATDAEITSATAGTFLGRYLFDEYRSACREWPSAAIAADTRTPVTSRVPTLLVSGAFDPVTPPAFAVHVQRTLPLARWMVSPIASHGAATGCLRSLVLADLEHGSIDVVSDECGR